MKKIIRLTESDLTRIIKQVINERLEDIKGTPLYHKTSTSRGLQILDSDKLIAGETNYYQLMLDKRLINTDKQKAISFTRNKKWFPDDILDIGAGSGGLEDLDITFVLDKDKLKTKYIVEPFNFSGIGDPIKKKFHWTYQDEYEERVLTDEISPLHKYIIDIIYNGNNPKVQEKINNFLSK